LTFTASDFNDGAAFVFLELTLSNGNRFNAAVGTSGNTPEKIHILSPAFIVKSW